MADVVVVSPGEVAVGQEFELPVQVSGVVDFDACEFELMYNPALGKTVAIKSGEIGGVEVPVSAVNEIAPGVQRVILNIPGFPGVSGDGNLCVFVMEAMGVGEINFDLINGYMNNNLAETIEATWSGDSAVFFRRGDTDGDGMPLNELDIEYLIRILCYMEEPTAGAISLRVGKINSSYITILERLIAGEEV